MEVQPTRELLENMRSGSAYADIARRVRSGDLVRLRRGAVRERADLTPDESLRLAIDATARVIHHGTFFSHRSAALLLGLPVFLRNDTLVEVVRTMGGHATTTTRLHARAAVLQPEDEHCIDGLPVTSLTRTTLDLVRTLPFAQAVMVADAALRLGANRDVLLGRLQPGRGCRMAERALLFADAASESAGESESRAVIAGAGLPVPELQVEIRDGRGHFVARPDFLWRGKRVVGEYDGEGKYSGAFGVAPSQAFRLEKERQAALEGLGYFVLRWDKHVLRTPGELARRVRRTLASRPEILAR